MSIKSYSKDGTKVIGGTIMNVKKVYFYLYEVSENTGYFDVCYEGTGKIETSEYFDTLEEAIEASESAGEWVVSPVMEGWIKEEAEND